MPERDFSEDFTDEDRMIVLFETRRGTVVSFRVQYQAEIAGTLYPVVRYDTAHGYPHRDLLDANGDTISKTPIGGSLNYALGTAIDDIKDNWERYRLAFVRRIQ